MIVELLRTYATSFLGTLGFALLLHAPRKAWLPASLIGGVSYTLYILLLQVGCPQTVAMFGGALAGSLLAQVCARRMRMIATIFITLSIVSLVPGLGLYRCMEHLGAGRNALGLQAGVSAMIDIMMIALGLGVGGFVFRAAATRPGTMKG